MKRFVSHLLSAILGAFFVVILMIGFNKLSTIYPIYLPKLFYKEQINYQVNVDSQVSQAISQATDNVIQVNNYQNNQLYGTGSGVIYKVDDSKAYIVTNNHVVEGATSIEVQMTNGTHLSTTLLGTDVVTDLAVLSIDKGSIDHVLEFSDSSALKVGDYVIAIGNPLGLSGSATLGIISSTERQVPVDTNADGEYDWYASVLQTDAAINPGNSGGALINLAGKLVGINSMKIAEQNVEGIGFSIPSNLVMRIIAELESTGNISRIPRLLGVSVAGVVYNNQMAYMIDDVTSGSVAEQNGLLKDDLITEINNQPILYSFDLKYYFTTTPVGASIELTVVRNNQTIDKEITITAS